MFGGIFHDWIEGPWEQARGPLKQELEMLQQQLASQLSKVFDTGGTLNADAFDGDAAGSGVVYISNEGDHGKPQWAKVNVSSGVKNRLRLVNFVQATASTLLGRGSSGSGDYEPITISSGLLMSGTALSAPVPNGAKYSRTFLFMGS